MGLLVSAVPPGGWQAISAPTTSSIQPSEGQLVGQNHIQLLKDNWTTQGQLCRFIQPCLHMRAPDTHVPMCIHIGNEYIRVQIHCSRAPDSYVPMYMGQHTSMLKYVRQHTPHGRGTRGPLILRSKVCGVRLSQLFQHLCPPYHHQ